MYASASNGGVQGVPRDALPETMTGPEEIVFKPRQECAGYRQHEPNDAKVPVPLSEQSVETVSPEAGAGVGSPAVSEAPANVTSDILDRMLKENPSSDILDRALKENRKAAGVVLLAEAERYAEKKMTEFKLIGPQLQGVKRERLIELQKLVSEKGVEFQTILDEDMSKMAVLHQLQHPRLVPPPLTRDELSGMPDDFVDGLEDAEDGKKGLTHKWPDLLPAMQQCTQEATCETLHTPRARQREEANTPLLEDTLRLRCEELKQKEKQEQEVGGVQGGPIQGETNRAEVIAPVHLSAQSGEAVSPEAGAGVGSPAGVEAPANVSSDSLDRQLQDIVITALEGRGGCADVAILGDVMYGDAAKRNNISIDNCKAYKAHIAAAGGIPPWLARFPHDFVVYPGHGAANAFYVALGEHIAGRGHVTRAGADVATSSRVAATTARVAASAVATSPRAAADERHTNPKGAHKPVKMLANAAAALMALRDLSQRFKGREWPKSKAEIKTAIASLYREQPAWLREWSQQASQLANCNDDQEEIKTMANIFKDQWHNAFGVLAGSAQGYKWNTTKMTALFNLQPIPAHIQEPTPWDSRTPGTITHRLTTGEHVELVQSIDRLEHLLASDATLRGEAEGVVAVDCEGVPEALHLLQLATRERVLVLDGIKLGQEKICQLLAPLLTSRRTVKLLHDLHKDAAALATIGGVEMSNCLDSQLAMERVSHTLHMGFNEMLKQLGSTVHPSKLTMRDRMASDSSRSLFSQRPLPREMITYAAMDVTLLLNVHDRLVETLGQDQLAGVMLASELRSHYAGRSGGRRRVCVDDKYALASRELVETFEPGSLAPSTPLVVSHELEPLIQLLPADIAASLSGHELELSDIQLDKSRRPQAWCAGKRVFLGAHDRVVGIEEIDDIVAHLGGFGSDNRAGLEAQLHRISAIRNRAGDIIGLTMRVGRHVCGNAEMIRDVLFKEDASILFLGEPGSGKTTIVREATRLLAEMRNVLIVDTSNEIAGDGDVPHPCVGLSRRLQVCSLDDQCRTMIEGVQNHTPEVMVIDEIGRPPEVEAARTCKTRGVRMIASAHGDLRKLLKNKQLRGLVGGVESVTLGDAAAKEDAKRRGAPPGAADKLKAQRAGPPIFDVIVELRRGEPHEWRIVLNAARAVDQILEGGHYASQRRTRDPATGEFFLQLENA